MLSLSCWERQQSPGSNNAQGGERWERGRQTADSYGERVKRWGNGYAFLVVFIAGPAHLLCMSPAQQDSRS